MTMHKRTSRRAGMKQEGARSGMAVVEFALILPLVFLLIMGMIESGGMFLAWLTVQEAAQVGARFAATGQGYDEGTRMNQIVVVTQGKLKPLKGDKQVLVRSYPGRDVAGGAVENSAGSPCDMVEVEVRYAYDPITPLIGPMLPDTIPLSAYDRKVNEPWEPCSDS